ncbi:MAG: hypothetical protein MI802_22770 [Desulfobacterales bacterium]|nr:hypothetical protein [Desulfobacterales bacterium]
MKKIYIAAVFIFLTFTSSVFCAENKLMTSQGSADQSKYAQMSNSQMEAGQMPQESFPIIQKPGMEMYYQMSEQPETGDGFNADSPSDEEETSPLVNIFEQDQETDDDYDVLAYALDRHMKLPAYAGIQSGKMKILTQVQWDQLLPAAKEAYPLTGSFCGKPYFFPKNADMWLKAHSRYKHELVIKERRPEGLVTICDKETASDPYAN